MIILVIVILNFLLTENIIFSQICSNLKNCNECINTKGCGWFSSTLSTTNNKYDFSCVKGDHFNCFQSECSKPHLYYSTFCPIDLNFPIKQRRSIRKYIDVQVSNEIIESIIENGIWAPNCMNYQPLEFFIIQEKDILKNISDHTGYTSDIFYGAPTVIFIFVEPQGDCGPCEGIDAGLAIQNMELTAYNLGLGTCTIGRTKSAEKYIKEVVGAKDSQDFIIAITLGHPAEEVTKTRNPPYIKYI